MSVLTAPLQQRSNVRALGPLRLDPDWALERETPLFAAERGFARDHGGPITRAFLDALPDPGPSRVLVDSSLVWLVPGLAHAFPVAPRGRRGPRTRGVLRFVHEPFPCAAGGVKAEANRNREAVHYLCVLGLPCTPEAAVGELDFATAAAAEAFWLPGDDLEAREREVVRRLRAGSLRCQALPVGELIELRWGSLIRARPATAPGFQLALRATVGARRPAVNGRRNLAML